MSEENIVTLTFDKYHQFALELTNKFNDIIILSNGEYLLTEFNAEPFDLDESRP